MTNYDLKAAKRELQTLIRPLKKKIFHGPVERFGIQKYHKFRPAKQNFQFDWLNRPPNAQDFEYHFFKDGTDMGNYIEGCLGFVPLQRDNIVTQVTFDCDEKETREFYLEHIRPKFDKLGIDNLLEHGGNIPYDRCHGSVLVFAKLPVVEAFFRQFMGELEEPIFLGNDERYFGKDCRFDEVYGVNQPNRLCRFKYGFNAKPSRMRRYPLEYKGDDLDDTISVVKAIIDMKPITEEFMLSYIKDDFFPKVIPKPELAYKSEEFKYQSIGLPVPIDYLPEPLKPIYENCQALNGLMNNAVENELIEQAGQKHHDSGFALAGTFRFVNVKYGTNNGKIAWERFKEHFRPRDPDAKMHNWWWGPDKDANFYIWTCDKYEKKFGNCEGCPFRGRVNSPRDFLLGVTIKRTLVKTDTKLVDINDIRNKTLKGAQEKIISIVKSNVAFREMDE